MASSAGSALPAIATRPTLPNGARLRTCHKTPAGLAPKAATAAVAQALAACTGRHKAGGYRFCDRLLEAVTKPPLVLGPTAVNILRLEKHSKTWLRGSASLPAGRAANAVRSQAEPGNEMFTAVVLGPKLQRRGSPGPCGLYCIRCGDAPTLVACTGRHKAGGYRFCDRLLALSKIDQSSSRHAIESERNHRRVEFRKARVMGIIPTTPHIMRRELP